MNMRICYLLIALLMTNMCLFGQEPEEKPGVQEKLLALNSPAKRLLPVPQISMQRALKFAKSYLRKQGLKTSELFLIEAQFTFAGAEKNPPPVWRFRWRQPGSGNSPGTDDDIYVFMNGNVWNPPEM